ncbi:MAG: ribbon-helix-helix domain-containing protein [Micrococcales bacterium]|nr:ribbon-helix-helix domain-containing protein [Micrococcales bacterium]MCL2667726.1 ribbon-helix-helix domain-containing protein [Micrococcales bacterium]
MQRTNIYLDDRQVQLLDQLACQEKVSRAEVVRRLLDRGLAGMDSSLDADLDAIDLSYGSLVDVEYSPRGDDDRQAHLDQMWQVSA